MIAIPLVLPVMILFPVVFSPAPTSTTAPPMAANPLVLAAPLLFGVGLGALFLGLTAIGQEGGRLWNVGSLPIGEKMLVKAKLMFSTIVAMIGLTLGLSLAVLIFQLSIIDALIFSGLGIAVVLAESSLGIAVGSRYADFSEGPRPRFVTIAGSIIGSVLGIVLMVVISVAFVAMFLLSVRLVGFSTPLELVEALPFLISGLVALILSRIGYRLSLGPVRRILREIPN